jgi:son of sevenless-like protein
VFSSAPVETPWYMGEDYPASDIIFDDKGAVRAGTLPALVARLTPHGSTDTTFFQAFLIMFRSFTTGPELLQLLIERYNLPEPAGVTPVELAEWKKMKQTPIRLR